VLAVPATLDPFLMGNDPNNFIMRRAMNVDLTWVGSDGKLDPMLAQSWTASGTTWTFKLRADAKFSDGSPVTAGDVKFSWETFADPKNKYPSTGTLTPYIKAVNVVDAKTAAFETTRPDAVIPQRLLRDFCVVPEKAWTAMGVEKFAANPIGVGPYRFKSFNSKQTLVMESNPYHWSPGKVATVTFQSLPDEAARVAALKSGQVNLAARFSNDSATSVKSAGKIVQAFPSGQLAGVRIAYSSPNAPDALKDLRVRQAIAYALDKTGIVKAIEGDYGLVANELCGPNDFGYVPDLKPFPYDPAKAKQLIQQAGAQGTKLTMNGILNDVPLIGKTALQAIADALNTAGLAITIEPLEAAVYLPRVFAGKISPLSSGVLVDTGRDIVQAYSGMMGGPTPAQYAWHTPQIDKLMAQASAEVDPAKRLPLMQQIIKQAYNDIPYVPLGNEQAVTGMDNKVKNFWTGDWGVPDWVAISAG